jgi:hypothetical protein
MADEGVATAIEMAQYMAGHADPRTTKLYDGRQQKEAFAERTWVVFRLF